MSNHYTYRAEWSPEDGEYVGLVAEFPSLSWLAATAGEAIAGASRVVDDILADMNETGETAPTPLTERRYSGNLSIRTSPDQHRQLTIEAAEQGVSVNQWIIQKLSALRNDFVHRGEQAVSSDVRVLASLWLLSGARPGPALPALGELLFGDRSDDPAVRKLRERLQDQMQHVAEPN